jgi:hypothetical protein
MENESLYHAQPPVACSFPDMLETSPKNLILCLIYFFGTGSAIAAAFYLYLKEKRNRDGYGDHRQDAK